MTGPSHNHTPKASEVKEPQPSTCRFCDFSTGRRGMDRCKHCDGTGSVFFVKGKRYPNTEEGYLAACKAAGFKPILEPKGGRDA